ncbi:sulfatase [Rhizobium grahamii CCGE 502]|uniref:Sulfatase n=1 Tax=Rhizobium grahamii CCGE 502 TaxID=990285 RepID=S3HBL3_9HYPH|nr:sulfatase [Rhizobium grahamii CCGE 502]
MVVIPLPGARISRGRPTCAGIARHLRPRADPYERADITSNTYYDWFLLDGAGAFLGAPAVAAEFLATFKDFPPSKRAASFSIDQIVEKMQKSFEAQAQ